MSEYVNRAKMEEIEIAKNNHLLLSSRSYSKGSQVSVSSISSGQSDSSEDNQTKLRRKGSLQDIICKAEDKKIRATYKRCRSMSDGATTKVLREDPFFEVFPSLPNSVLEKMGLLGDSPRERMSEEELEQKFTSLCLAFTIDSNTVKDRFDRQKRLRDQSETNLSVEMERLKERLVLIQPLCTDYERAELLSTLLTQVDVVMKATYLMSISAERYGAVQHEERLSESVLLMVQHVQLLKQQRDSARRQLQYTKRVLQNPSESPTGSQKSLLTSNIKVVDKRRASISTFSQPLLDNAMEMKKVIRRTSDLSLRATFIPKNLRPNRLELSGDLVKIKEGFVDDSSNDGCRFQETNSESFSDENNVNSNASTPTDLSKMDVNNLTIREKMVRRFRKMTTNARCNYRNWTEDGTIHDACYLGALLCFLLSLLGLVNVLVELEYTKRGMNFQSLWSCITSLSLHGLERN